MAVAEYVLGDDPPPPELTRAFDYKAWGVNVHDLPPGEVRRISAAYNVWGALDAYLKAGGGGKSVDWTQRNPDAWELVSWIIAERKRRKHGRQ